MQTYCFEQLSAAISENIFMQKSIFLGTGIASELRAEICRSDADLGYSIGCYDKHVTDALERLDANTRAKRFLEAVFIEDNFDQPLMLANQHVRRALGQAIMISGCQAAEREPSTCVGASRARLVTTIPDLGYVPYTGGQLNLRGVRGHFDSVSRKARVEGLGLLDLALVHAKTASVPDVVSLHYHGVVRSFEPRFKPKTAARQASKNKQLNQEGLSVVDIRAHASPLQCSSLVGLLYYVSKISCGTRPTGEKSARTAHGFWTWIVALRGLEIYSHCEAMTSLPGVGPFGVALRRDCKGHFMRLLGIDRLPRGISINHDALRLEWGNVYRALGMPQLAPFTVR